MTTRAIADQQKKAQSWFRAFQARRKTSREAFMMNAVVAGLALKDLAKTPPV